MKFRERVSKSTRIFDDDMRAAREERARGLEQVIEVAMDKRDLELALRARELLKSDLPTTKPTTARPAAPRPAFIGRKYKWTDPQFGKRGWFTLKEDYTVTAGWHEREGVWAVRPDGTIVAGISALGRAMSLRPSADGKSLDWAQSGKQVEMMD